MGFLISIIMSLLQSPQLNRPTSEIVKEQIQSLIPNLFTQIKSTQQTIFRLVWHNTRLTPQEVCDALGTDAQQLFELGADNVALILKYDSSFPTSNWKPPFVVQFNGDGTVTITDTPNE